MPAKSPNPIQLIGGTIGVAVCLLWLFATDNKIVNLFKGERHRKTSPPVSDPLGEVKYHELGQKYLRSFKR